MRPFKLNSENMYSDKIRKALKELNIDVGDTIRVLKQNLRYEGILLPRAEGDPDCLVLKIQSGYNIGIEFDDKTRLEKVTTTWVPPKWTEKEEQTLFFNERLPTISIIGTGGTVSSRVDYRIGGVYATFSGSDLVKTIPELKDIANLRLLQVMKVMSEDMNVSRWKEIAHAISNEIRKGVKGVVITHGTDTMHFTSAALAFMLRELPVPIALVGSQRSPDRSSSDTFVNMVCACHFVAKSDVAEPCIVMHGTSEDCFCFAHRGTKVRKMHTSARNAFRSINDSPIAKIFYPSGDIEIINSNYRKRDENTSNLVVDDKFEPKVAIIKSYPGADPDIFDFYIEKGYRGFVIEATGLGHVATLGQESLLPKIEQATLKGIPVAITSQCLFGRVNPSVYRNLREVAKRGAIYCEDILPEVAYVKLMWILGHTTNTEEIKRMMLTNVAGEINSRTTYESIAW